MLEINKINNTSIIINSLDKIYKKAQLTAKLNSSNLYILNVIYDLLDNCCLELSNEQRIKLMDIYRNLYFCSENICKVSNIKKYKIEPKIVFEQAETTDCNQYTKFENIYYWQEENFDYTINNVLPLISQTGFFQNKLFDTEVNFNLGVDCSFSKIGYVCFAILDSLKTDTYKIYDILNNDITHMFQRVYVNEINTILFVSNNIYSHSITNIKIKKTTDIFDSGVFNNIFNNIFN
jgi:hypothetical protein